MALRDRRRIPTLQERLAPPTYATGKQTEPVPARSTLDKLRLLSLLAPGPLYAHAFRPKRVYKAARIASLHRSFHTVHIV